MSESVCKWTCTRENLYFSVQSHLRRKKGKVPTCKKQINSQPLLRPSFCLWTGKKQIPVRAMYRCYNMNPFTTLEPVYLLCVLTLSSEAVAKQWRSLEWNIVRLHSKLSSFLMDEMQLINRNTPWFVFNCSQRNICITMSPIVRVITNSCSVE